MAASVSILRKLISQSFYNKALPKSNLRSESARGLGWKAVLLLCIIEKINGVTK